MRNKNFLIFSFFGTTILFLIGILISNYEFLLISSILLVVCNIVVVLYNWKKNIIYILFMFCFFLFLLSKPIGCWGIGREYWNTLPSHDAIIFSFILIYLSLTFFSIANFSERIKSKNIIGYKQDENFIIKLQKISYYVFIIGFSASCYEYINRIIYFSTNSYLSFYNGGYNTDNIPVIFRALSQLMLPGLVVLLSTMPPRKLGYKVLSIFLLSNIPTFVVGQRAPIMLALFFCMSYSSLRDIIETNNISEKKEWFGKKKISFIVLLMPLAVIGLSLYNELRNNIVSTEYISKKLHHPLYYFFTEQGGTLDLLSKFYTVKEKLPQHNYCFGYSYDVFFHNEIVSKIFDIQTYTGTNLEYLSETHTLAAHLSYLLLGNAYFEGNSVDSSFLLDIFADYSYVGVAILSFVLAKYLLKIPDFLSNKNWLIRSMVIYSMVSIFILPRTMLMSAFSFVVSPYFWMGVLVCYVPANLLTFNKR